LLATALGPEGYYAVITANMHTDLVNSPGSDSIIASARTRGVPVVSARQMLRWLDGRNGSFFSNLQWSGATLSFTVGIGEGGQGLVVMLPTSSPSGSLTSITRGGAAVTFTTQTIKGVTYAVFSAALGSYQAVYGGP
jgi:hypothetical protein